MSEKKSAYQRKPTQQRRQELIDAGIQCLGKGGMAAFTIDKICKQANVSRGLINHHFKTKNELLLCIYASMTDYLVKDQPAVSPRQQVSAFIEGSLDEGTFQKSNLRAWLSIWGEVATNPALKSLHEKRYAIYKNRLATSIALVAKTNHVKIDEGALARQLIALIDGLWLEYCLHSKEHSLTSAKIDCYQFIESKLS
jgi:AcrR family transcriptional regulator